MNIHHETILGDFANLIANMSRFLVNLSGIPSFNAGKVNMLDRIALVILSENDGMSGRQLLK